MPRHRSATPDARDCRRKGQCVSWSLHIWDCACQGLYISGTVHVRDCTYQGLFLSGTEHIRECSCQVPCISGTVRVRVCSFHVLCMSGTVHVRQCKWQRLKCVSGTEYVRECPCRNCACQRLCSGHVRAYKSLLCWRCQVRAGRRLLSMLRDRSFYCSIYIKHTVQLDNEGQIFQRWAGGGVDTVAQPKGNVTAYLRTFL